MCIYIYMGGGRRFGFREGEREASTVFGGKHKCCNVEWESGARKVIWQ